jgi:xylulose-5-phosphate/fructose-6-phosphate phosphoketolase
MTVLNHLDRFHLAGAAVDGVPRLGGTAGYVKQALRDRLVEHRRYVDEYGIDMPEILNWRWGA